MNLGTWFGLGLSWVEFVFCCLWFVVCRLGFDVDIWYGLSFYLKFVSGFRFVFMFVFGFEFGLWFWCLDWVCGF